MVSHDQQTDAHNMARLQASAAPAMGTLHSSIMPFVGLVACLMPQAWNLIADLGGSPCSV